MKLMLFINMFVAAALTVATSALTTGVVGAEKPKALAPTHLASAFRDDSTLRFMRKMHAPPPKANAADQAEAERSKLCEQHGFKAAERAGCVAFMRQACDNKLSPTAAPVVKSVPLESCTHFFQQKQPGYESKVVKQSEKQNPFGDAKDWQQGPKYDSKKAQKATDKALDGQKPQEVPGVGGVADALDDASDAIGDAVRDAQKGPNYHKADEEKKPEEKEPASEDKDEPEDKEVPSVPGCKNSPKGWMDKKGNDCEDYAEGEWCNRHGGYGDAWLDEWGTFEDVATKGKSAKQVCCVCGGGVHEDEDVPSGLAPSPAAAPSGSPAAAPAGSPALTGPILGTKGGRPLQSQGYSGDLVAHEDGSTMTSDWGREFGPHAGHRDIRTICAESPGNEWCELHGYYDSRERSSTSSKSILVVFVALLLSCLR